MKLKKTIILVTSLGALFGCSTDSQKYASINEEIKEYVLIPNELFISNYDEWLLTVDWLDAKRGGAAIAEQGLRHVLKNQLDIEVFIRVELEKFRSTKIGSDWLDRDDELESTKHAGNIYQNIDIFNDADVIAWRKYCHNRIGLTAEEIKLLEKTPYPKDIKGQCEYRNVYK